MMSVCSHSCPSTKVMERRLSDDRTLIKRIAIPVQQLVQLTELCLRFTYFKWQVKFYKQTDGAAMCSPRSPIIANLFMEQLEEEAIQSAPSQPAIWTRYADCTFVIWQHGDEELARFHRQLNQQSPSILNLDCGLHISSVWNPLLDST